MGTARRTWGFTESVIRGMTRLANEHDQATPADERILQGRLQRREFCLPAHKDAFGKTA